MRNAQTGTHRCGARMMRTLLLATLLVAVPLAALPTASAGDTCTMAGCLDTCNMYYCVWIPGPEDVVERAENIVCSTELC